MNPTTPTTGKRIPRWAFIVVALLAGHVTLMATAVTFALRGYASAGVEPDYYNKAVAWDANHEALERSTKLGWTVTLTPDIWLDESGHRTLAVTAKDAQSQAIHDARVSLHMHHAVYPSRQAEALLKPQGKGTYAAKLSGLSAGLWRVDLRIETEKTESPTWFGRFDQIIADGVASNQNHRDETNAETEAR